MACAIPANAAALSIVSLSMHPLAIDLGWMRIAATLWASVPTRGRPRDVQLLVLGCFHAQIEAPLTIDLQQFHLDLVPQFYHVAHLLDTLVRKLRDVHQAVTTGQNIHKRAKFH